MSDATHTIQTVRIQRRGGIAGLAAHVELRYAALSTAQRAAVDRVAGTPSTKSAPPSAAGGNDRFSFRLEIVHASGESRVIEVPEDAMPGVLAGLAKPAMP